MRKIFAILAVVAIAACGKIDDAAQTETLVVKGYMSEQTRTEFGTPRADEIPYKWSAGDYMWLGNNKSTNTLAESCSFGIFNFSGGAVGTAHLFYNMTGQAKNAKVLAEQTADGNLGNDGDFGYATLDEYNTFTLDHKTAYIWFDTKTNDSNMPKLTSIKVEATVNIAGECEYKFNEGVWADAVTNGSKTITLNFEGGYALKSSNEGVMAAMVCLPAAIGGTQLIVTYTFADGSTYTETKNPSKNLVAGKTSRIATTIAKNNLVAPAPEYELKVLTFEDGTQKFSAYDFWTYKYDGYDSFDKYQKYSISKWSDLIPDTQHGDPMHYGVGDDIMGIWSDALKTDYYWSDLGNTMLKHTLPSGSYRGGGHVISDYVQEDIENIPSAGWWAAEQLATPIGGHNSSNFCVHNGYSGSGDFAGLAGFEFADGKERVIDHMYVTNTSYALNSLTYGDGFAQPAGNTSWFKIVAIGYKADGTKAGELEFLLCNGKANIVTTWKKFELKDLGAVKSVKFNMYSSTDMHNEQGMATPAYFAYDDVAVWVEK